MPRGVPPTAKPGGGGGGGHARGGGEFPHPIRARRSTNPRCCPHGAGLHTDDDDTHGGILLTRPDPNVTSVAECPTRLGSSRGFEPSPPRPPRPSRSSRSSVWLAVVNARGVGVLGEGRGGAVGRGRCSRRTMNSDPGSRGSTPGYTRRALKNILRLSSANLKRAPVPARQQSVPGDTKTGSCNAVHAPPPIPLHQGSSLASSSGISGTRPVAGGERARGAVLDGV
ncbi:unnamed protein product [Lampetra fluviatilis]